jgi:hypothetical protein
VPDLDEQVRLTDAFIERYVYWREQCAEVESAYERWRSGREDADLAFAIYCVELEFEERAAGLYRESAERLALATSRENGVHPRSQRGEACPTS